MATLQIRRTLDPSFQSSAIDPSASSLCDAASAGCSIACIAGQLSLASQRKASQRISALIGKPRSGLRREAVLFPIDCLLSADIFDCKARQTDGCPRRKPAKCDRRGPFKFPALRLQVFELSDLLQAAPAHHSGYRPTGGAGKLCTTTSSVTVSSTAQLNCRPLRGSRASPAEPGLTTSTRPMRPTKCRCVWP